MPPDAAPGPIVAVVLAGGLARRMGGGDKVLKPVAGRPLLAHVLDRLRPQVTQIVINANGDLSRFAEWDLPVAPDSVEGFAGPLAGVLAGLDWAAAAAPEVRWVVSVPGDAPFLPTDLVARLLEAIDADSADMACAASDGRHHPVAALWPIAERQALRRALVEEQIRKVDRWTARYRLAVAEFDSAPVDPFFNANTPDDIAEAERLLAAG